MDKIQKFLLKLAKKERSVLVKILDDVKNLNINRYDVKALKGCKGFFRLRKGNIRILFVKQEKKGLLINVAFRKDAYK